MKILYGLKDGALLQRDETNLCKCFFSVEAKGKIISSLGNVECETDGRYILTGIPVGGPYNLTLFDDEEKIEIKNIYVGDLWLLGGQSNMEGAGKVREQHLEYDNNPVQSIRAYYMNENWGVAKSQLHQLWESADACISSSYRNDRKQSRWKEEYPKVQRNGVGPGLYFALEMQNIVGGVPQGVIPCGVGGASLHQWKPNGENNYYSAAKRRVSECGGNIKGVFWYQGESQCCWGGCDSFVSDMKELVQTMRTDFHNDKLPFVQVQINKYRAANKDLDGPWTKIRELQRTLCSEIPYVATVYSNDCELDDLIHLSSESQSVIGKRGAEAMANLVFGVGYRTPDFESFEIVQDDYVPFFSNIVVNYKNVVGGLKSLGVPFGFYILEEETSEPIREIARIILEGSSVRLKVEIDPLKLENYYVCYAYGNTFYCNITDGIGRCLPGFGPLKIKDYLKK